VQFHFAWDEFWGEEALYLVEGIGGKVLIAEVWTFSYKTKIINKINKSNTIGEWQVGIYYRVQPAITDAILKIGAIMAGFLQV